MADVPDAPDALVDRLRFEEHERSFDHMPVVTAELLSDAADRIEADAATIAQQDEMIHEIAGMPMTAEDHASMERVGKRLFGEDFSLGPFVPTSEYAALNARLAEAESLLSDSDPLLTYLVVSPRVQPSPAEVKIAAKHVESIRAFLASAPPEAPQQTALERLAERIAARAEAIVSVLSMWYEDGSFVCYLTGYQVEGRGPTPDAALHELAGAVAPTEPACQHSLVGRNSRTGVETCAHCGSILSTATPAVAPTEAPSEPRTNK